MWGEGAVTGAGEMGGDVAVIAWVEQGKAPNSVTAMARGAGPNVVNTELPASWSANRTRRLCAYPKVARYNGTGDVESASSFSCK